MLQHIKQLSEYFLIGVLAILPIVIVIEVVLLLKDLIAGTFFSVYGYVDSYLFTSILFAVIVVALSYIGYSLVQRRRSIIISTADLLVEKIPLINTIYRVSKKVIAMFSGGGEGNKREVVYIEYPKNDIWVPAYVTNRKGEWYVLFVPTSPNPTSGFTVVMHESKVVKSALNIEEVTSFIVSVGSDFPKADEVTRLPH
ncbi:DUF502 domain-containing protein [Methylococcus sp. EFPC2]|uniref:DUF502 domain-containing protein n=1 Tax=Methylococcus sp. EFPC2 TaxID=2812648 RepID=UPI001966D8C1|nr:DUF502 domain-containing protein [Methylococcus sp. EFPC2]QSA95558.1 DUF502 domain-containing protein [Methylococcus sp. EFPC2]